MIAVSVTTSAWLAQQYLLRIASSHNRERRTDEACWRARQAFAVDGGLSSSLLVVLHRDRGNGAGGALPKAIDAPAICV